MRAGTLALPLTELLDRQFYRLASWRVADEELNYRRFFDVGTLVAIRVERPAVFDATHRLVLELMAQGFVDGLRIDHPDGLADPRVIVLDRGRVVADGPTRQVLNDEPLMLAHGLERPHILRHSHPH